MSDALPEIASALPCASCGYDLRATPRDGICPECATPVQKAVELAAIPVRPAWRDSDPRWRRRMVAGAWVMVLVPLVDVLQRSGLAARLRVPAMFEYGSNARPLEHSFVTMVYTYLAFCIGVVLFFSKERYRRRNPLDWTRRWGVIVSYAVFLLGVPLHALVSALVMVGIAASFMSLPFENQPAVTGLVKEVGAGYLLYGPHDSEAVYATVTAFSACAILLACVPIYDALRCSASRVWALVLLAPLAVISVWQIAGAVHWYLNYPLATDAELPAFFFEPGSLLPGLAELKSGFSWQRLLSFMTEAVKWLIFLGVAIWLSVAQAGAWRKSPAREPGAP